MAEFINIDEKEFNFLLLHYLKSCPFPDVAEALERHLATERLLPERADWQGQSHALSYGELVQRYSHIKPHHLPALLSTLVAVANGEAPVPKFPVSGSVSLTGERSFALVHTSQLGYGSSGKAKAKSDPRLWTSELTMFEKVMKMRQAHPSREMLGYSNPLPHRTTKVDLATQVIYRPAGGNVATPFKFYKDFSLLKEVKGHLKAVYCAIYDKTGNRIFTGSDDGRIKVWSALSGNCIRTLRGHGNHITHLAVDPTNRLLASGSVDNTVRIWYIKTGAPVALLQCHDVVTALAWNPNPKFAGHIYVGTRAGIVRFWQPAKDIPYLKDVAQALRDLSDSQDNEASTQQQPHLSQSQLKDDIANAETEAELIPFTCQAFDSAEEQVNTIVCSPGGTCVASGGDKGTVQFFTNIGTPAKTQTIGLHDKKVTELVWSHGGDKLLTGADDGTARVLEFVVSQNKWVCSLTVAIPVDKTAHAKPKIGSVGWSLNDELIITGLHSRKAPIKVWDTRITEKVPDKNGPGFTIQPTMLYSLKGHDAAVISVDAHPTDPRIYLSAGYDSRFMMWNVYTGEILLEMQRDNDIDMRLTTAAADSGPSFADCHFSPHGDSFIVSDKNGMLFIFGNRPKAPYSLGPADQFFKSDNNVVQSDVTGALMDSVTGLAPHTMPREPTCMMDFTPTRLQPPEDIAMEDGAPFNLEDLLAEYAKVAILEEAERNKFARAFMSNSAYENLRATRKRAAERPVPAVTTVHTLTDLPQDWDGEAEFASDYEHDDDDDDDDDVGDDDVGDDFLPAGSRRLDRGRYGLRRRRGGAIGRPRLSNGSRRSSRLLGRPRRGQDDSDEDDLEDELDDLNSRRQPPPRTVRSRRVAAQRALTRVRDDDSDEEHDFESGAPMLDAGAHPGSGDEYNVGSDSESDHGNTEVRSNESNDGEGRRIRWDTDRAMRRQRRNHEKKKVEAEEEERLRAEEERELRQMRRTERARKPTKKSKLSYPTWLTSTQPTLAYAPQLGDRIVYFRSGHEAYLEEFEEFTDQVPDALPDMVVCDVVSIEYFGEPFLHCTVKLKTVSPHPKLPGLSKTNPPQAGEVSTEPTPISAHALPMSPSKEEDVDIDGVLLLDPEPVETAEFGDEGYNDDGDTMQVDNTLQQGIMPADAMDVEPSKVPPSDTNAAEVTEPAQSVDPEEPDPRYAALQNSSIEFTVHYNSATEAPEFLVLLSRFTQAVLTQWFIGKKISAWMLEEDDDERVGKWYDGEVSEIKDQHKSKEAGETYYTPWESLLIKWTEGDEDDIQQPVSPWEIEPLSADGRRETIMVEAINPQAAIQLAAGIMELCEGDLEEEAQYFVMPVDLSEYPQYYSIIPCPSDFGTICQRLKSNYYRQIEQLVEDIRRIELNAAAFNSPESEIAEYASNVCARVLELVSAKREALAQIEVVERIIADPIAEVQKSKNVRENSKKKRKTPVYREDDEDDGDDEDDDGDDEEEYNRSSRRSQTLRNGSSSLVLRFKADGSGVEQTDAPAFSNMRRAAKDNSSFSLRKSQSGSESSRRYALRSTGRTTRRSSKYSDFASNSDSADSYEVNYDEADDDDHDDEAGTATRRSTRARQTRFDLPEEGMKKDILNYNEDPAPAPQATLSVGSFAPPQHHEPHPNGPIYAEPGLEALDLPASMTYTFLDSPYTAAISSPPKKKLPKKSKNDSDGEYGDLPQPKWTTNQYRIDEDDGSDGEYGRTKSKPPKSRKPGGTGKRGRPRKVVNPEPVPAPVAQNEPEEGTYSTPSKQVRFDPQFTSEGDLVEEQFDENGQHMRRSKRGRPRKSYSEIDDGDGDYE